MSCVVISHHLHNHSLVEDLIPFLEHAFNDAGASSLATSHMRRKSSTAAAPPAVDRMTEDEQLAMALAMSAEGSAAQAPVERATTAASQKTPEQVQQEAAARVPPEPEGTDGVSRIGTSFLHALGVDGDMPFSQGFGCQTVAGCSDGFWRQRRCRLCTTCAWRRMQRLQQAVRSSLQTRCRGRRRSRTGRQLWVQRGWRGACLLFVGKTK